MPGADNRTTRLSTKGQVILPAEIRRRRHWNAGMRLVVEDTPEGVLLSPAPVFPRTRPEEVFDSLSYKDAPKSPEDMAAGIAAEALRRHDRGRY